MRCSARWRRPSARAAATTAGRPGTSSPWPTSTSSSCAGADVTGFRLVAGVMLITGGSRGIGAATARRAAEQGYKVAVNYVHNKTAAENLAREIGGVAIAADVALEKDVLRMFQEVDKLGRISVLVNNAGIVDRSARVDEMTAERINRMFAVN